MNKKLQSKIFFVKFVVVLILLSAQVAYAKADINLLQQNEVTMNMQNSSVKDILREIQKQTNLNFVYNENDFSSSGKKSINVKNVSIDKVINDLLINTDLTYKIVGTNITIVRKTPEIVKKDVTKFPLQGKIVDESSNVPISGATVIIVGTTDGAISDDKGDFSVRAVAVNDILEVSYIGMVTMKYTVKAGDKNIIIKMTPDAVKVDDVIVTGIFTRKSGSYTGSSVTVTSKELKQYGNRNVLNSLRNIDPSFNIIENNAFGSNPNKLPEVQMRGNSSLPNVEELKDDTRVGLNTPLIILDGFEVNLQRLVDMNDNEIESITLLKDASATAIYGSRGANGVVVISSKAPVAGRLRVTYRGDINMETPDINSYSLLNAREKLDFEKTVGKFVTARAENQVKLDRYYNYLLSEVNSGVDTHWLSQPIRVGVGHRHNLRLEGGDQTFRYSASAQYNNTKGVMKGSDRNNFNGTINLTYLYKNIKFTNSLVVGINKSNESPYGDYSRYTQMNPYYRIKDENGKIIKKLGQDRANNGFSNPSANWSDERDLKATQNPLYDATLNTINSLGSNTITDNFSIDWTIAEGLIARARLGISQTMNEGDKFYPAEHTKYDTYTTDDLFMRKGEYTYTNGKSFMYDGSVNISYSKQIKEKHFLFAGLDYNMRENSASSRTSIAEGFTNENLSLPSMALGYKKDGKPSGSESLARSIGMTANVNYTYDNRYYADLSGRIDGSSAFGSKNRFAPFWSTGLGWNIQNEKFLKDVESINMIKFRASAGITGSQNFNPYQSLETYKYYTDDRYYMWTGNYLMGLGNNTLKWQQKINYNIGIDTRFFNNRLSFTADFYTEETKDLISSVDIPLANGFPSYTENIGSLLNRGFEAKLTGIVIRNDKWFWSITGAVMHNRNKITKLSEALKEAQKEIETAKGSDPNKAYREGFSTSSIWVVPSLGIDPSSGKEVYMDRFGNITHTWDARDIAYCGIDEPKYQGNLNTMLRYKNLTLSMSFGYRFGGQVYNSTLINKVENVNYDYNFDSRVATDRWQKPGDVAKFKSIFITTKTNKTSRFVQNENTFNCQNASLMYELKSDKLRDKIGIELLTVTANMDNLFYISTVKRERGTAYPFSRMASLSINITF